MKQQKFLRSAITGYAEINNLHLLASQVRAVLQIRFRNLPESLVHLDVHRLSERVAKHSHPNCVGRLDLKVFVVAQTVAVDAYIRFALFAIPTLDVGTQRIAERRVRHIELWIRITNDAQANLGHERAQKNSKDDQKRLLD